MIQASDSHHANFLIQTIGALSESIAKLKKDLTSTTTGMAPVQKKPAPPKLEAPPEIVKPVSKQQVRFQQVFKRGSFWFCAPRVAVLNSLCFHDFTLVAARCEGRSRVKENLIVTIFQAQKEILDTELDIIAKQNEGEDTSQLRKRVALLKREVDPTLFLVRLCETVIVVAKRVFT